MTAIDTLRSNRTGLWTTALEAQPGPRAQEVAAATGVVEAVETLEGYEGSGTIATYTVTYDGTVPARVVAVCDTADGRRCVSISEDDGLAAQACVEELVGTPVHLGSGTFSPT